MTTNGIDPDDLTDDEITAVLNSRLFVKGLKYRRLADGIEVLEDDDEVYTSLVTSIHRQHSSIKSRSSVEEVLDLFREEVRTFTEPLAADADEDSATTDELRDTLDLDDGE